MSPAVIRSPGLRCMLDSVTFSMPGGATMISSGVQCSRRSIAVMILVVLAGYLDASGSFCQRTLPDSASITIALAAETFGWAIDTAESTRATSHTKGLSFFILDEWRA